MPSSFMDRVHARAKQQIPDLPQVDSEFRQPDFGTNDATSWEGRQQGAVDRGIGRYGLGEFLKGGAYSPEMIQALAPQMQAPSVSGAMRYGVGAQDMAARGAGIASGAAMQGIRERVSNPAALSVLGAQIAQQAGSQIGAAGTSGYQQGLGLLQQAGMANQQTQAGLLGQSIGNTYGVGMAGMQSLLPMLMQYWQQRHDDQKAKEGMWGQVLGNVAGLGAAYLTGGASGAAAPVGWGAAQAGALQMPTVNPPGYAEEFSYGRRR